MRFKSEAPFNCPLNTHGEEVVGLPLPRGCSSLCPESCICIMRVKGSYKHYKPLLDDLVEYIAEGFNPNLMFYSTVQGLLKSRVKKKHDYEVFNYVTSRLREKGFTFVSG